MSAEVFASDDHGFAVWRGRRTSELLVTTDHGELIEIPCEECDILQGGFAATFHKTQGIEVPAPVVVCRSSSAGPSLTRSLLHTALTRATKLRVLVGDRRVIAVAVQSSGWGDRHPGLSERPGDL